MGAGLVQAVLAEQRIAAVGGERDAWQEQCEELTRKLECTQEALKEVTAEREALAGDVEDYEAKVLAGHAACVHTGSAQCAVPAAPAATPQIPGGI